MSNPSTIPFPSAPSIDAGEARWAADELGGLLRRIDPDSVAGSVLRHAQQELRSLLLTDGREVLGPVRVPAARRAA